MVRKRRLCLVGLNLSSRIYSAASAFLHAYCLGDPDLRREIDVERVDVSMRDDVVSILADVLEREPDIVGLSTLHGNHAIVRGLAGTIRALHAEMPIIVGGLDASHYPELFLGPEGPASVVVRGEGEITFGEILRAILGGGLDPASLSRIPGVSYFDGERVVHNPERPVSPDLGEIPSPILTGAVALPRGMVQIETYRGCPYECAFCYEGRGFSRIRLFPFDRVKEEIRLILEARVRLLRFYDTTWNYDAKRTIELLRHIAEHNRGTECHAEMKLELLNPDVIELLPKAGFREIEFGMQTINRKTLVRHDRSWNKERFEENLRRLKEKGIRPILHVMGGLPGDALDDTLRSVDYAERLGANTILFHTRVVPGTPMAARPAQDGCVVVNDGTARVVRNATFSFREARRFGLLVRAHEMIRQCMYESRVRQELLAALGMSYAELLSRLADWIDAQGLGRSDRFAPDILGPEQYDPQALDLLEAFIRRMGGGSGVERVLAWARFEHLTKHIVDAGRAVTPRPAAGRRVDLDAIRPRKPDAVHLIALGWDISPLLQGGEMGDVQAQPFRALVFLLGDRVQMMKADAALARLIEACDGSRTARAVFASGDGPALPAEDAGAVMGRLLEMGLLEDAAQHADTACAAE